MSELIKMLPDVMLYLITGYLYISVYRFTCLKESTGNAKSDVFVSLIIGYLYVFILNHINISVSDLFDTFAMIIGAPIIGYLFAMFVRSQLMLNIFRFLRIGATMNKYYWDDLLDTTYPMRVEIKCQETLYKGMVNFYQSCSDNPHIILASYKIINYETGAVINNESNTDEVLVVDTSHADYVRIVYDHDSKHTHDIKSLCDYHKQTKSNIKQLLK